MNRSVLSLLEGCRLQGCMIGSFQSCRVAELQSCKVAMLQGCKVARVWGMCFKVGSLHTVKVSIQKSKVGRLHRLPADKNLGVMLRSR